MVGTEIGAENERIISMGYVSNSRLRELYIASDLFLFPSYSEGFSLAIVEGLSVGLPPIIRSINPATEVIKNGINGFIASHSEDFSRLLVEIENGIYPIENIKLNAEQTSREIEMGFRSEMEVLVSTLLESVISKKASKS